ncbi:MAG TPA: carboxypeptidase regulatory-like domain-containing protein, partial [Blastocatellia bacterium]|nr:carboxypeptidase regulatory-like domain-containing protein [Blastocatellia bacterium]
MKRTAILLAVSFLVFAVSEMAQAQIRIAHYDFENNTTRATFETTVKRQAGAGNSTLVKVGKPTTINKAPGAGMALHGATSTGSAASAAAWSAVGFDPVTNATTYYQFTIDTSGFTGASLSFDVLSGTTSANHPHIGALLSTDGGRSYSPLIAGFDPGNNSWVTQSVNLPAAADNNSKLVIRIYGYHSDGASKGTIAIDNISVFASSTLDSAQRKNSPNEIDVPTVRVSARSFVRDNQTATRMVPRPSTQEQSIPLRSLGLPAMTGRFVSALFADKTTSNGRVTDPSSETRLASGTKTTETASAAQQGATPTANEIATTEAEKVQDQPIVSLTPTEGRLVKANSFDGDLRNLPYVKPVVQERPEHEPPDIIPVPYGSSKSAAAGATGSATQAAPVPSVQAPAPIITFAGLDFATFGAGHPPDTNGDVGPNHYIQAVNTSIGIYNKSTGSRITAFSFNTFMSQGSFGNLCDTNNGGDPVVLYDTFEDRWIITDLAFSLDGSNNVINPPGAFQCIAVSKTGDPVSGGWNFYSINTSGGLGDYPKFGIWPDGLYMSANMFGYSAGAAFQNTRLYAFNKAQMYAGSPTAQTVSFDAPSTEFTLLPANARLQTGTPPAGSPNYYAVVAQFLNAESIYKFHVDWDRISTSTFTGPFISTDTNWWEQLAAANQTAPTPANRNDELYPRLMMQNQYTNIGGVESLWTSHTVGAGNPGAVNLTATQSAVRYYQVKVTGGAVEAAPTQAWTHSPDASLWRYMPSVAVDRAGDMAIGYTTSNAATNPALQYAGRLAGDPVNSITQTEQLLFQGTGAQSGSCGGTCTRWGDYSAMTLDPDGCTFWYTNEYYATTGLNNLTRIGSFKYPSCTSVGSGGTVSGTVTDAGTSSPISGATVALGARTTTTNGSGVYSFTNIPAGTYPSITASFAGYGSSTATTIAVSDSATTTRNFALTAASTSACPVDTSQADFQTGVPANTDLTTSAGNVTLANPGAVEQQSTTLSGSGFGMNTTSWFGQTFTAGVTGPLIRADINLFCSGCTGTSPNLTLSLRATSGGLPTGADLASTTLTGNASGAASYFSGAFASPPSLTSGTVYALIIRPVSNPSAGTYAITKAFTGTGSAYAGGTMVNS